MILELLQSDTSLPPVMAKVRVMLQMAQLAGSHGKSSTSSQ
jgi:hypothetical protein